MASSRWTRSAKATVEDYWRRAERELWQDAKPDWHRQVRDLWVNHVHVLACRKIRELTVADLRGWHSLRRDTPYQANRALAVLKRVLDLAVEDGAVPGNVARMVKRFPEMSRARYATREELSGLIGRLEQEPATHAAATYLLALIFTGARPRSILKLQAWELQTIEVEGESWGLYEFAGKGTARSGEAERVLFPPELVARIVACNGLPVREPKRYWYAVRHELGLDDLRMRDLRRTFATMGFGAGVGVDLVGGLLNHRSAETTRRYARLAHETRVRTAGVVVDAIRRLR